MQFSFFDDDSEHASQPQIIPLPGADVVYMPRWLADQEATAFYHALASSLSWSQDTIKL